MGPEQLIKTATGQRRRRLRDEARSRRQWRHLCCDRAGCWPSAGAPGVSGAAQWLAFRSPPLPSLGLSSFVGGVITRYGSGAEQSEDDVGCRYDQQSGFEYSDTGSGPARRLRRQYPRDWALVQRLGADERGPRRVAVRAGHDHAHPGCDGVSPVAWPFCHPRVCPSVVADPATMLGPRACRADRDTNSSCSTATMHGKSLRGRGGAEQPGCGCSNRLRTCQVFSQWFEEMREPSGVGTPDRIACRPTTEMSARPVG
jgi:hypothetical protein